MTLRFGDGCITKLLTLTAQVQGRRNFFSSLFWKLRQLKINGVRHFRNLIPWKFYSRFMCSVLPFLLPSFLLDYFKEMTRSVFSQMIYNLEFFKENQIVLKSSWGSRFFVDSSHFLDTNFLQSRQWIQTKPSLLKAEWWNQKCFSCHNADVVHCFGWNWTKGNTVHLVAHCKTPEGNHLLTPSHVT